MPPKRNITDFFRPFAQAKRKASDSNTIDNMSALSAAALSPSPAPTSSIESSSPLKNDDFTSDPPTPTQRSPPIHESIEGIKGAERPSTSFTSALSSLPSEPPSSPGLPIEPRRTMRRLSPLSMSSSNSRSGSATPQPPPRRIPALSPPPTHKRSTENGTSFVSTSTLSAPPVSSQSSSRRIVKDGQLAVTNSDSDSMDPDDDPLDEIEELIRRKRLNMATSAVPQTPAIPTSGNLDARELRSSRRDKPSTMKRERLSSPPRKKYKFSLANLVKQTKTEVAWSEKQKEYEKQQLQDIEDEKRRKEQFGKPDLDQVADQLGGPDANEHEKAELVRALKRMDAMQDVTYYHFFKRTDVDQARPEFPLGLLAENKAWESVIRDQSSREEAFKTGFVADVARVLPLPDEILQWVLRELLYETQSQLSLAYVCAIDANFKNKPGSLESLRTRLLEAAGRGEVASATEVRDSVSTEKNEQPESPTLLASVRWSSVLVGKVAKSLPITEQRSWLHLLMLALIDSGVQHDSAIKMEVQHSLAALFEAVPPDRFDLTVRNVGLSVLASVPSAVLIHRLLCSLPSTGEAIHGFKRRLALSYFMKSEEYLNDDLDRVSTTAKVAAHLQRSVKFKIRENTNYEGMAARIGILDIAIGAGFSDFSFLPEDKDKADTPVIGNGVSRVPAPNEDEKAFNEAIDSVVAELRNITSNIRDAGAAHMQRIECKGMLDKLGYRLEYAARTRAKPKKEVFSGSGRSGGMFQKYLQNRVVHGGAESYDRSSSA